MDKIKSSKFILRDHIDLINECTFHLQNKINMLENVFDLQQTLQLTFHITKNTYLIWYKSTKVESQIVECLHYCKNFFNNSTVNISSTKDLKFSTTLVDAFRTILFLFV